MIQNRLIDILRLKMSLSDLILHLDDVLFQLLMLCPYRFYIASRNVSSLSDVKNNLACMPCSGSASGNSFLASSADLSVIVGTTICVSSVQNSCAFLTTLPSSAGSTFGFSDHIHSTVR